jgi:hypothetical protein
MQLPAPLQFQRKHALELVFIGSNVFFALIDVFQ